MLPQYPLTFVLGGAALSIMAEWCAPSRRFLVSPHPPTSLGARRSHKHRWALDLSEFFCVDLKF
jgi:hypothetical protein